MKNIAYSILLLFVLQTTFAQNDISSLYAKIDTAKDDNTKAEVLAKISDYYFLIDEDSAKYYYYSALDLYKKTDNKKGQVHCLSNLSVIYYNNKRIDTAIAIIYRAIELGEESSLDTLLAKCYLRLGNYYSKIEEIRKAKGFYFKSLKKNIRSNNNSAWGALGIIYRKSNQLDSASFYIYKSLKYFQEQDTNSLETMNVISALYNTLGIISFQQNKPNKGLKLLKESLRISKKTNNNRQIISGILNLSIGYDEIGKPLQAETLLLQGLYMADTLGYIRTRLVAYNLISEHYVAYKDFKSAYKYLELYKNLNDSLERIDYHQILHENEIKYLSQIQEEKLRVIAMEEERTKIIFSFSAIISAIILILIIFILYWKIIIRTKEKKSLILRSDKLDDKLELAIRKLSILNEQLAQQAKLILKFQMNTNDSIDTKDKIVELKNRKILYNDDWLEYIEVFDLLHPNFLTLVLNKFPDLSEGDKRQLIMLKLEYSRNKSSEILGISIDSVRRGQQRLSKKLKLKDVTELGDFVSGIDYSRDK